MIDPTITGALLAIIGFLGLLYVIYLATTGFRSTIGSKVPQSSGKKEPVRKKSAGEILLEASRDMRDSLKTIIDSPQKLAGPSDLKPMFDALTRRAVAIWPSLAIPQLGKRADIRTTYVALGQLVKLIEEKIEGNGP